MPSSLKRSQLLHWVALTRTTTTVTGICAPESVCLWPRQLAPHEARERQELRACLRRRRLQDEMRNSPDEMQVLR